MFDRSRVKVSDVGPIIVVRGEGDVTAFNLKPYLQDV
jgi:hypothetical protein